MALRFGGELPGEVERVCQAYRAEHLAGARLVFAATDNRDVNEAVVRDAKAAGVWVNRADGDDGDGAGNFIVPAQFNNRGVIVTVSAGSAAVSAAIRDQLAERFDPAWAQMAAIAKKLRPLVLTSGLAPSRRAQILRDLAGFLSEDVKEEEAAREWLLRRLAEESQ